MNVRAHMRTLVLVNGRLMPLSLTVARLRALMRRRMLVHVCDRQVRPWTSLQLEDLARPCACV